MSLQTRRPTGRPAWPLVLVDGEPKAGKSFSALSLSADPRVGRTFVFDLGDGTADEYAALGPFEIVETNGTFSDLHDKIRAAAEIPAHEGRPNVIVIDSGSDLWDLLKRWTDHRARASKKGRAALAEDPDAEIDPSMNLWNDAKERWALVVNVLRRFPGVGVITAQGGEVARLDAQGRPMPGKTDWSTTAEKTLPQQATAIVRLRRDPRTATLVGVRRLGLDVPAGGLALPLDATLGHVVFDLIGAGSTFAEVQAHGVDVGMPVGRAKSRLLEAVRLADPGLSDEESRSAAQELWQAAGITSQEVSAEQLAELLAMVSTPDGSGVAPSGGVEPAAGGEEQSVVVDDGASVDRQTPEPTAAPGDAGEAP